LLFLLFESLLGSCLLFVLVGQSLLLFESLLGSCLLFVLVGQSFMILTYPLLLTCILSGTIPADNWGMDDGVGGRNDYLFANGIRNPFRSSWDIPTNRFFAGEVGEWREDIHILDRGESGG
jgi:hypothetical protein